MSRELEIGRNDQPNYKNYLDAEDAVLFPKIAQGQVLVTKSHEEYVSMNYNYDVKANTLIQVKNRTVEGSRTTTGSSGVFNKSLCNLSDGLHIGHPGYYFYMLYCSY